MRYGRPVHARARALDVDVNPLRVTRAGRECVDACLIDGEPRSWREIDTYQRTQSVEAVNDLLRHKNPR